MSVALAIFFLSFLCGEVAHTFYAQPLFNTTLYPPNRTSPAFFDNFAKISISFLISDYNVCAGEILIKILGADVFLRVDFPRISKAF
jgi:hypothetical protein